MNSHGCIDSVGRRSRRAFGPAAVATAVILTLAARTGWAADIVSLGEALNAPQLPWQSRDWQADSWLTHDGTAAANCQRVMGSEGATLETTLDGPGLLEFWWFHALSVSLNLSFTCQVGSAPPLEYQGLSPDGWDYVTLEVPPGPQPAIWMLAGGFVIAEFPFAAVDEVVFTPLLPPVITQAPAGQTAVVGEAATFSVTADGARLSYQWLKGSWAIPDATNAALVLTNVQALDAGFYSVVVSNVAGPVASPGVPLTVLPCLSGPRRGQGRIEVELLAWPSASAVVIESSTDLTGWSILLTNPITAGRAVLALPFNPGEPARFFRARVW